MKDDAGNTGLPHSLATLLARACDDAQGSITPPIVQSSLFSFDSYDAFEDRMAGRSTNAIYTRVQNPTVASFEALMASAEEGESAIGFASGMGAISSTILALVKPGDRIICVEHVYPDAYRLFERILKPFGVSVSYHPISEFAGNADLFSGANLAYLESPNSLLFESVNLVKVAEYAKRQNTITVIDNSWATPHFQRPLAMGIDIVVHSASKYISGHSDTVAGVVVSNNEYISAIRDLTLPLFGAKLAPFEAWLLVRGLRTLVPRMERHERSANYIIERLGQLPETEKIHTAVIGKEGGVHGRSGLFSIQFCEQVNIRTFCNKLALFRLGVSWGGFESLALPAKVGLAQAGEANSMQQFGVPGNLVRLSIGLEDPEDLWQDLHQAIRQAVTGE